MNERVEKWCKYFTFKGPQSDVGPKEFALSASETNTHILTEICVGFK